MGLLDSFDNPGFLSSLLGPDMANAMTPPSTPPDLKPTPFTPGGSPVDGGMLTPTNAAPAPPGMGPGMFASAAPGPAFGPAGPPPNINGPTPSPDDRLRGSKALSAFLTAAGGAPGSTLDISSAAAPPPPTTGIPAGPAAPGAPPGTAPPLPPPTTVGPTPSFGGPPMPPNPGAAAPPTSTTGSLYNALGIQDPRVADLMRARIAALMDPKANAIQAGLSGLGKGLSAMGSLRPGATGAQAFAVGAGGALTGGAAEQQQQHTNQRAAINDLFNQSSAAFKDVLAGDAAGDRHLHTMAQIAYLTSRAQSIAAGKGSNAWQNTPEGRIAVAEQRIAAFDTPRRRSIDARASRGILNPEEAKAEYEALEKKTEEFRQNTYRGMKINPTEAERIKTLGTKENPYDARTMSESDFNLRVPLGGWYKDHKGNLNQRTEPPPGAAAPATPDPYGEYHADSMALTPPG